MTDSINGVEPQLTEDLLKCGSTRFKGLMLASSVLMLLFGEPLIADSFKFRVAFENVAGVDEIEAGNIGAGIRTMERQLGDASLADRGDVLASLCGAYLLQRAFDKAAVPCEQSVSANPSDAAFNNRGVYRAHTGNLRGARQDFERARPDNLAAYMDRLHNTDVRLMADANYALANELAAMYTERDVRRTRSLSHADVEDPLGH